MNYLYAILGTSAFFFILLTLMDWETQKRDARQRAEWDKPVRPANSITNVACPAPKNILQKHE